MELDSYKVLEKVSKQLLKIIPETQPDNGRFQIIHKKATKETVRNAQFRAMIKGTYGEYMDFEPGTYVILEDRNSFDVVMSTTPMEHTTQAEFVRVANGHVLIAGLGLGLVLLAIQKKKNIKSITVVEKEKEIIDLIVPHLPLKKFVKIIQADIFEWQPDDGVKFDTIYFDIWNNICADHYEETKILHKRFRKYLNRKNPESEPWMDSWRREDFKRLLGRK